ncbi:heavy metal-associated isoprenylated plant protein 33-like [Rhagoletis pomonella]|uniref:heavy metal-associated isoprenylated plant protein 33-like n=1 Tax=Rhagoletis pomonella TaxID=28610 RepID=UPI00177CD2C5|nr:heavy metal-associated isoprenylated plant protein 33-like [Rhagoletis pomonella]
MQIKGMSSQTFGRAATSVGGGGGGGGVGNVTMTSNLAYNPGMMTLPKAGTLHHTSSINYGRNPGGGGGGGNSVGPSGLRISTTPQSPIGNAQQGPISSGGANGINITNSINLQQQQQQPQQQPVSLGAGSGGGTSQNSLLNTPPDPTMNFSFDTQDFFSSSVAR